MRVLGISGTPRQGGNSEILLGSALSPFSEQGWEVKKILLSQKNITRCVGCETCVQDKTCAINDDMGEIYEEFEKSDAIIISAPTYFRNVPAQLKAVFDRTHAVEYKKPLAGKLGGAIAVGRGTGGGQTIVLSVIYNYYLSCGALCVPGELNGVTALADKPGDIRSDLRKMEQAKILGENIIKYSRR